MEDIKRLIKAHHKWVTLPLMWLAILAFVAFIVIGIGAWCGPLFAWVASWYTGMTFWGGLVITAKWAAAGLGGAIVFFGILFILSEM